MPVLVAVFAGGCLGGLARYGVTEAWPVGRLGFPWATLAVNSSGAFLLAALLVVLTGAGTSTTYLRSLLGTGFCGAWTTFSSIVVSADQLVARGAVLTGATYVVLSAVAGLGSAWLGAVLARGAGRRQRWPLAPVGG